MQAIETFVVKVLRDRADPEALRGLLTCVATGDQFPYADGAALLELLRRIAGKPEAGCASSLLGSVTDREQQE